MFILKPNSEGIWVREEPKVFGNVFGDIAKKGLIFDGTHSLVEIINHIWTYQQTLRYEFYLVFEKNEVTLLWQLCKPLIGWPEPKDFEDKLDQIIEHQYGVDVSYILKAVVAFAQKIPFIYASEKSYIDIIRVGWPITGIPAGMIEEEAQRQDPRKIDGARQLALKFCLKRAIERI